MCGRTEHCCSLPTTLDGAFVVLQRRMLCLDGEADADPFTTLNTVLASPKY